MIVNLYSLYASETTANYLTIGYLYAAAYYIYVYTHLQNYYYYLVFEKMPLDKPEIQPCNMKVKIAVYHQYTSPWWVIDLSAR